MRRVPEPELMDDPAQALAYASADFDASNDLFVATFTGLFPGFDTGRVLDIGCGPADIPIRLASATPGLQLVATDGAEAMLALADQAVAAADLSGRIQVRRWRLGAETGPEDVELPVDAVISNSLLHHLVDPQTFWEAVVHCAGPDSPVLLMDLKRPLSINAARAIVDEYARDEPELLRDDFLNSLLAAYREDELTEQLAAAGLGYLAVEQVSDRHLIVHGRLSAEQSTN